MKKLALFLLLVGTLVIQSAAQSRSERVDALFAEWDHPDSPGVAVAIQQGGLVVHRKGYGIAQLEYGIPITPSTIFHVASVSKEFTAFAVGLLAEQGKLSWDDDIRKFIPEVPDFGKKITLRHLVHHISGMRDQWEILAIAGWRLDDVITKDQILQLVSRQKDLNFSPGDEYLYCNTGFTLLAEVVARVTGKSFREWTKEQIFNPLGMTSTHFHDDHQMIVPNRAYSYSGSRESGFQKSVLSYANAGATSLFTTVEDMMNWASNFSEPRVGSKRLIRAMTTPARLNSGRRIDYAMGLTVGTYRGLRTIGHGGADAGFRSQFLFFPDNDFSVMVMSNLASFNGGRLVRQIADIYLSKDLGPEEPSNEPEDFTPVMLPPEIQSALVGHYQLPEGALIELRTDAGQIVADLQNRKGISLQAKDNTTLINREAGIRISISGEPQGQGLKLKFGNQDLQRVTPMIVTGPLMAEFQGEYYSPELDTTYRIRPTEGRLEAVHQRHPPNPLTPGVKDQLFGQSWFFRQLRFSRDAQGRVNGFHLQGGRVRGVWFEKR